MAGIVINYKVCVEREYTQFHCAFFVTHWQMPTPSTWIQSVYISTVQLRGTVVKVYVLTYIQTYVLTLG